MIIIIMISDNEDGQSISGGFGDLTGAPQFPWVPHPRIHPTVVGQAVGCICSDTEVSDTEARLYLVSGYLMQIKTPKLLLHWVWIVRETKWLQGLGLHNGEIWVVISWDGKLCIEWCWFCFWWDNQKFNLIFLILKEPLHIYPNKRIKEADRDSCLWFERKVWARDKFWSCLLISIYGI